MPETPHSRRRNNAHIIHDTRDMIRPAQRTTNLNSRPSTHAKCIATPNLPPPKPRSPAPTTTTNTTHPPPHTLQNLKP